MSRHALQDVAAEWSLNQTVAVKPLSSFLDKLRSLRPEIADPWQFSHYLQINPKIDIGRTGSQNETTPLEVLTAYATDPDGGRDQDLFLRDEAGRPRPAYDDQVWFGVVQGPNSQAFRHIEKPPFHLLHPIATFGFPFRKVGQASRRAEIYHQLSLLAFALGEDYWGWRFLANAFHYLQDLHQPYHAGQVPPSLLKKSVKALSWGWAEKGFMGTFAHIVANSHRFFESFIATPGEKNRGEKEASLQALEGKDLAPGTSSFEGLAVSIRDASNRVYGRLARAVSRIADPRLDGPHEFRSDEDDEDDPLQFLKEGPDFEAANREIFAIVQERFASAGRVMRTAVSRVLEEKNRAQDPKAVLEDLDELLGLSPFQSDAEDAPGIF